MNSMNCFNVTIYVKGKYLDKKSKSILKRLCVSRISYDKQLGIYYVELPSNHLQSITNHLYMLLSEDGKQIATIEYPFAKNGGILKLTNS